MLSERNGNSTEQKFVLKENGKGTRIKRLNPNNPPTIAVAGGQGRA
jgi:hypothetical protein